MAINRDPAEWFGNPDRLYAVEYGICKTTDDWLVLKKEYIPNGFGETRVEVLARAPTRAGAIGFLKLLRED
jgi:hypothetical protein